jgi:hypothetical protein
MSPYDVASFLKMHGLHEIQRVPTVLQVERTLVKPSDGYYPGLGAILCHLLKGFSCSAGRLRSVRRAYPVTSCQAVYLPGCNNGRYVLHDILQTPRSAAVTVSPKETEK